MRVLIIAEDPTQDYLILEPVITAMLRSIGRAATIRICRDPHFQGVNTVLKKESLEAILRRYQGMVDLFLLCVDRDGEEGRRAQLDAREQHCSELLAGQRRTLIAEHAWQEVEVWALAGCLDLPNDWSWKAIRAERDPKEAYFDPYVQMRSLANTPGTGRQTLGRQAGQRYDRLRQICPEDIVALEERVREWLMTR
ncbi:MAG: hypothetical protein HGA19_11565 [Oscillochloris sp.]|nr:hypothetical protein [Oscillochloris sp.]